MKDLIKILLAFLAICLSSSIANAGDRPKPLNEISTEPTKLTNSSPLSSQNDTTTPVELSNPAKAIDNAISSPQKDSYSSNSVDIGQNSAEPENAGAMDNNKTATEYNKPAHKTKKHSSKHHKKSKKSKKTKKSAATKTKKSRSK